MIQGVKRCLFSSRKVIVALLALILIGAVLLALTVFAQGEGDSNKVTLTISDAEGYVGEKVWVEISISGVDNLLNSLGVTKIAGGQLQVPYGDSGVDVKSSMDINYGELISDSYKFKNAQNHKDAGDNVSVVWAGSPMALDDPEYDPDWGYHRDGQLWRIRLTLENAGSFVLPVTALDGTALKGLVPANGSEEEVVDIPLDYINFVHGTITIKSRQLDRVDRPTWDGDVIEWNNVENAANYEVKLYKGGELKETRTVNQGDVGVVNSCNFSSKIAALSPGVFTVTVQAIGEDPWTDGPVSEASDENAKIETLAKVAKPAWSEWSITWNDVANADKYEVKLYLASGTVPKKTVLVNPGIKTYDFSADTAEAGSYTATVRALGDGTLYLDGDVSDKSDAKIRKVKLATVDQPTWSAAGVLTWSAVENAASYEVQLFKNNISVAVLPPTTLSTQNLLELMHDGGAGDYTATVKALAAVDGYYEDGDASDPSAVQEIVQLVASQPTLSDEGVAGWSAVTNADGYTVQLYKDGSMVEAETVSGLTHDFLEKMRESTGNYTVTVIALGTGLYLNSAESTHSAAQAVSQLPAPTNVRWDVAPFVKWDNVAGATGYQVQLYRSGAKVGSAVSATDGATGYDFTALIGDVSGYYTAKVRAVGDDYLLLDSPYSDASDTFTKTGPLGQVTNLNLSDKGVLTWVDEPHADEFLLQLYKGGSAVGNELIVAKGVQSADFRTAMRSAGVGIYTVTVIAKGSGLFADGPALESNSQAVSKLAAPTNVSLSDKGVSTWERDEHASQSNVRLYLPAGHPSGQTYFQYSSTSLSKNLLAEMRQFPGNYYVKVWVEDNHGLYLNSDESAASETRTVEKLAKVGKPELGADGVAVWTDVAGATGYAIALYKDNALVAIETAAPGEERCDLLEKLEEAGTGSYNVTVIALGDEYLILDGDVSDPSDAIVAVVLDQVDQPVWRIDEQAGGTITLEWNEVEGARYYEVIVYSGHDDPEIFSAEINSLRFVPDEAGFYWAEVRAMGSGIVFDGPFSEHSNILVSFNRNPVAQDEYLASGELPVPGYLWMEIVSATGNDGVMVLSSSTDSDHPDPEGLTAAGIFFDVEFDENLRGSKVNLKAGYDPAALPERIIEKSLRFYRYDDKKGWQMLDSGVDLDEKTVFATIDQFSTIGIFGEVSQLPVESPEDEKDRDEKPAGELPRTYGYVPYLLLAGLLLALAGLFFYRHRKRFDSQ